MDNHFKQRLDNFLSHHKVLTLSYLKHNNPGACALWYAHDTDFNIYYLSSLSTRHGETLQEGGNVAITIQKDQQQWNEIRGIQSTGYTKLVNSSDVDHGWKVYSNKFPFIKKQIKEIHSALEPTKLWVYRPEWLRLIDNSIKFGYKEEITFD